MKLFILVPFQDVFVGFFPLQLHVGLTVVNAGVKLFESKILPSFGNNFVCNSYLSPQLTWKSQGKYFH